MDQKAREVVEEVGRMRDEMVTVLQQLVRIPSVSGNEGDAQKFVRQQYESLGLEVFSLEADRERIESHPAFCDTPNPFQGRPNIIGIQKGNPQKKSIILNGHVDVVSPEPIDQWTHDPWGGEIEDNRLYGRGAMDMKSGLVANLFALKALNAAGVRPEGTVTLQSVIDEEDGGGGGALACFIEGYTADGMIVSEPAQFVNVALAGIMRFMVKVKGKSAHAAQSHLGVNAVGKILPIYQAIERLDTKRKAEVRFPLFENQGSPACHLIVGTLNCGDWVSTVAGFAEMGCRIGFIPGETREDIKQLVEDTVSKAAGEDPWFREHPPVVEWLPFSSEPYYQDPSHPFVKTVMSSIQDLIGDKTEVKPRGATWTEDTRFSRYFGFPAVSFGPTGERLHGVDEYVDLDSLETITKAIALATLQWCSQEKEAD
jgi:acetylornithine deacetylase